MVFLLGPTILIQARGLMCLTALLMGWRESVMVRGLVVCDGYVIKVRGGLVEFATSITFRTCSDTCCIMVSVIVNMKFFSASTEK